MPPLPRIRSPVLASLAPAICAGGRHDVLDRLGRAEAAALEIAPEMQYDVLWVLKKLGLPVPAGVKNEELFGSTLLADWCTLIEHACERVGLAPEDVPEGLTAEGLAGRWRVSTQTLARLRRQGLVGCRVTNPRRRSWLLFRREHVEAFERAHREKLQRATEFTRIEPTMEAKMRRRAARYQKCLGYSVSTAAKRIAQRHGRSHEAVRQLLLRAPTSGILAAPLHTDPPIDARRRKVLYRAWRMGVDVALMARTQRRSRASVRRAINLVRAQALRDLAASGALDAPAELAREDASAALSSTPARTGLGLPGAPTLRELIAAARASGPPIAVEERSRFMAYHALRVRAKRGAITLDRLNPSAEELDRAETDLLWAARLKAELMRPQLRLIIETLCTRLQRSIDDIPPGTFTLLFRRALAVGADAIDTFDPLHGGRLASRIGLAVDRFAAVEARTIVLPPIGRRATPVLPDEMIEDWTRSVCAWQSRLEPDRRVRHVVEAKRVSRAWCDVLTWRFGWNSLPPTTLVELMRRLGRRLPRAYAMEQAARRAALAAARAWEREPPP